MTSNHQQSHRSGGDTAVPIHIRRLERALNINPFLDYVEYVCNRPISDEDTSDSDVNIEDDDGEDAEEKVQRKKYMPSINQNLVQIEVGEDRKWLKDILIEDSDEEVDPYTVTESGLQKMLKQHVYEKKYRAKFHTNRKYEQYQYYSSSLLSKHDWFAENQKVLLAKKRKDKEKKVHFKKTSKKSNHSHSKLLDHEDGQLDDSVQDENEWEDSSIKDEVPDEDMLVINQNMRIPRSKNKKILPTSPEVLAQRRRKLWIMMSKKEVAKVQRSKANNHKEQLQACKRTAQLCMKVCRQKAMQSQKNMKETVWRCKRLTREMQSYWKRYDRVERETRRRMEKEAEEQRKMDVEMIEAKRQQRKLNFLITQTELYAHFMSKKLGKASPEEQLRILSQLDEEKIPRLAPLDDYDCETMKAKARKNAKEAFASERARTKQFDRYASTNVDIDEELDFTETNTNAEEEHPQPSIFKGVLKGYQLKGMNWLANLYDQGISGILADEMGLGKTVQSIAFLCHVAEKYSVWGPFLVISPASTLHNWQQEMAKFVPDFRVVPYWGSPNERKILRQFWEQKDLHTKEASFHVVITSYQIIITDFKYFNRIKWQYMILDEAQAIKSASSVRWKMLLGFSCRNRLLLSGTPIQNSMAELWALLHFIMPTLFDSHEEFNEWFSKDIESHAENKTGIDEKHLSRLHMILKPFMLRRIKKDVENELSDKIEVMVYCPLTTRQSLLYMALKKKIKIEDLLHYTGRGDDHSSDRNNVSNLMNLVMQFRKVCNHPELFERRDARSPVFMKMLEFVVPKLLYEHGFGINNIPNKDHLLYNIFYIWAVENVHNSTKGPSNKNVLSSIRLLNMSPSEINRVFTGGLMAVWLSIKDKQDFSLKLHHRNAWWNSKDRTDTRNILDLHVDFPTSLPKIKSSSVLSDLIFTSFVEQTSMFYTYTTHVYHFTPETSEHRIMRSKKYINADVNLQEENTNTTDEMSMSLLPVVPFKNRSPIILECQKTDLPSFLYRTFCPKVHTKSRTMYVSNNRAMRILLNNIHSCKPESSKIDLSLFPKPAVGMEAAMPCRGWFNIVVPDKETLVTDAGKLFVLDGLLKRLKKDGHRVLIYSQMTKMIDLLEEYMWHRKHKYMRLDGSSKISERRDMVADFQARTDIFVFLLSTRAGGLGINLTAADTVIFYDSDWNPTVDQQAMDRAHRLGQTKQVTVYRLICKGSIEERILQRAREKSEIQRMVISGGNFKPDTLKPKEVVSLLLDDEEIEMKYRQKAEERKYLEELRERKERDRKRKQLMLSNPYIIDDINECGPSDTKKMRLMDGSDLSEQNSAPVSPGSKSDEATHSSNVGNQDDSSNDAVVDIETTPVSSQVSTLSSNSPFTPPQGYRHRLPPIRGSSKRGRPRGSRRGGGTIRIKEQPSSDDSGIGDVQTEESSISKSTIPIRRGPGRPRLKPGGPSNQGIRGISRPRKPVRPLPVPLRSQALGGAAAGSTSTNFTNNTTNVPSTSNNDMVTCFRFYDSNDV